MLSLLTKCTYIHPHPRLIGNDGKEFWLLLKRNYWQLLHALHNGWWFYHILIIAQKTWFFQSTYKPNLQSIYILYWFYELKIVCKIPWLIRWIRGSKQNEIFVISSTYNWTNYSLRKVCSTVRKQFSGNVTLENNPIEWSNFNHADTIISNEVLGALHVKKLSISGQIIPRQKRNE